jgi:ABC-type Na+ efflux pump permease subunit
VCSEKSDGTLAFLVVKPVDRSSIVLSKFTAVVILALTGTLVSAAACVITTPLLFSASVPWAFAESVALVFVFAVTTVAIALLASTLFRSQAAAGTVATLIWMLLTALADIPRFGRLLPGRLNSHAVGVLLDKPVDWMPLVGSAALVVFVVGIAVLHFRRWEAA